MKRGRQTGRTFSATRMYLICSSKKTSTLFVNYCAFRTAIIFPLASKRERTHVVTPDVRLRQLPEPLAVLYIAYTSNQHVQLRDARGRTSSESERTALVWYTSLSVTFMKLSHATK